MLSMSFYSMSNKSFIYVYLSRLMIGVLFTLQFLLASCATDDTVSEPSPFVPTVQRQARYEVEKVKDVVYGYGYGYGIYGEAYHERDKKSVFGRIKRFLKRI